VAILARARIALALAADDRGDHAAAVAAFEEAFLIERPSPLDRHDVFATLGRAYGALGQTGNAIELYRRCLEEVVAFAPEDASLQTRYRIYLSYALSDAGDLRHAALAVSGAQHGAIYGSALGVGPRDVVHELEGAAHGRLVAEAAVGSAVIVEVEPAGEGGSAGG